MPNYVELEAFLADHLPEITKQVEKDAIGRILLAASAYVDRATGRISGYFSPADPAVSTRFFRGDGSSILRIPQHVAGTATVENVPAAAYYENPDNGWLYKYTESELTGVVNSLSMDFYPIWTLGRRYAVAARWGWLETPADIQAAVAQIALRWYETQKGTLGQVTPTGFVVERAVPESAAEILAGYTRGEFEI